MKVLAPIFQIVAKLIKGVVDMFFVVQGVVSLIANGMSFIKKLIDNVPSWLGGDALRNMVKGTEEVFSGDVIGNLSSLVDGMDLSFLTLKFQKHHLERVVVMIEVSLVALL